MIVHKRGNSYICQTTDYMTESSMSFLTSRLIVSPVMFCPSTLSSFVGFCECSEKYKVQIHTHKYSLLTGGLLSYEIDTQYYVNAYYVNRVPQCRHLFFAMNELNDDEFWIENIVEMSSVLSSFFVLSVHCSAKKSVCPENNLCIQRQVSSFPA